MRNLRRARILIITAVAVMLMNSCEPITQRLIAAIEDDFSPVITVVSPTYGDTYYSELEVTGYIEDDSLVAGDGRGIISSLSFYIDNGLDHKGRITIDASGDVHKDDSYGNVDIDFDPADNSFAFLVNTSDLGASSVYLRIEAVDFNSNSSIQDVNLIKSGGPHIVVTAPVDGENYSAGDTITIEGTVADSYMQQDSSLEIASIQLTVSELQIYNSVINIDDDNSTYIPSRGATFTYISNPGSAGSFYCAVSTDEVDDADVSAIEIRLTATDRNGTTSSPVTVNIYQIEVGAPNIDAESVMLDTGNCFYTTDTSVSDRFLHVDGEDRTSYDSIIVSGEVRASYFGGIVDVPRLDISGTGTAYVFDNLTDPSSATYFPFFPNWWDWWEFHIEIPDTVFQSLDGAVTLTMSANDLNNPSLDKEKTWSIIEDSDGPDFEVPADDEDLITASTGANYVGVDDSVTIYFKVSENGFVTGFDESSLEADISGVELSWTDNPCPFTDEGNDTYSVNVSLAGSTQVDNGPLDISISGTDYIGNPGFLVPGDSYNHIGFYPAPPELESVSLEAVSSPGEYAAPGDLVRLIITADSSLDQTSFDMELAGMDEDDITFDSSNFDKTVTATTYLPDDHTEGLVTFAIFGFDSVVNGSYTGADVTATTDSSSIYVYDSGPTLSFESAQSDDTPTAYAQRDEEITVRLSSDQPLASGIDVTIGGSDAYVWREDGGLTLVATVTNPTDEDIELVAVVSDPVNVAGISSADQSFDTGVYYYPDAPELESGHGLSLVKLGGNSSSDPEAGDTIELVFTIAGPRDLQSHPVVGFYSGDDTIEITLDANVDRDTGTTAPDYRYTYTVLAASEYVDCTEDVTYSIVFTDMAGNAFDLTDVVSDPAINLGP